MKQVTLFPKKLANKRTKVQYSRKWNNIIYTRRLHRRPATFSNHCSYTALLYTRATQWVSQ